MYIPGYQRVDDPERLWAVVEAESFASLICAGDDELPVCTQVPFIRREGKLWAHLAAANPQGELLASGRPVLCQFLGPHAYISPSWYLTDNQVPTWNFVQVSVTGIARELDAEKSHWVVEQTVREHESHRADPWPFERMAETTEMLLRGIRAFEIVVNGIEGRFKLSQNKSAEERSAVARELRGTGRPLERAVGELMEGAELMEAAELMEDAEPGDSVAP